MRNAILAIAMLSTIASAHAATCDKFGREITCYDDEGNMSVYDKSYGDAKIHNGDLDVDGAGDSEDE